MSKLSRYDLLVALSHCEESQRHKLNGLQASDHNNMIIKKSIFHFVFLSEDLMSQMCICDQSKDTRLRNLLTALRLHDFSDTLSFYKTIYDYLIDGLSKRVDLSNFTHFKGAITSLCGFYDGRLLGPVKESLQKILQSQTFIRSGCFINSETTSLKRVSALLLFLQKLNFKSVGLEEKALNDYLSSEEEMINYDLSLSKDYLPAIQQQIFDWMKDWDYAECNYQHGPGSVADTSRSKIFKIYSLTTDARLYYASSDKNYYQNATIQGGKGSRALKRCSKLVFVPKNVTKLRSISMEPATLQYHQQGVMKSLYSYYSKHFKLKNILYLKDQSWNKSFAYHGSITDDYATIDLSHASDSVNWRLLKQALKRVPKLLRWLVCTRSTHTLLPDGREIELSKFAPMGSALCFPIESLMFAAIASVATKIAREQALDRDDENGLRKSHTRVLAYGDDIIIPSYAAPLCIKMLSLFGFTPNIEKSFLNGPFKESCGGNYFCGVDITPIKFHPSYSLLYTQTGCISPDAYMALCSYANMAYDRGFSQLRLSLIHSLLDNGIKPLFSNIMYFLPDGRERYNKEVIKESSPSIFSLTPTNFHLKRRWLGLDKKTGTNYQKYVGIYTGIKSDTKLPCTMITSKLFDRARYLEWALGKPKAYLSNGFDPTTLSFDSAQVLTRESLIVGRLTFSRCQYDI